MLNAEIFKEPKFEIDPKYLSFISHHVRGQYNGLLGFSELLSQNYFKLSEEERLEYISQINATARKSFINIENMVLWLKIISNNISVNNGLVNLIDIFEASASMCRDDAEINDVDIEIQCENNISTQADRLMLCAIINNLLSNAIKASEGKGGAKIILSAVNTSKGVDISVTDFGKPIKKQIIIDYFSRKDRNEELPYNISNGLGLWVCNKLAQMMGREIFLQQEENKYKIFTIKLL